MFKIFKIMHSIFKFLIALVRLSAKPATIFYPYPIAALLAFSLSGTFNVINLLKAIMFSFLFYAGVNLWNHVNDVEEDIAGGKKTVITENPKIRKLVAVISPLLYLISFALAVMWSVDEGGIAAFIAAACVTWVYSDKILLGRIIKRWKDHYITETLAFVIFVPSFTSMLWTIYVPLSLRSVAFSTTLTFFILSGIFLKDLKDITGDKLAGLKTLGVVFSPEILLKVSFVMLTFYYFSILLFSFLKILPILSALSTLFSVGLVYTVKHFSNNKWVITIRSVKPLNVLYYSNLGSLVTFIVTGFT